jgi:hypothetical protein
MKLLVKTNPGEICPREEDPRTYVTETAKGTEVEDTSYYRRLVSDGSLVIVEPAAAKSKSGGDA